jgi:hypothetical protein
MNFLAAIFEKPLAKLAELHLAKAEDENRKKPSEPLPLVGENLSEPATQAGGSMVSPGNVQNHVGTVANCKTANPANSAGGNFLDFITDPWRGADLPTVKTLLFNVSSRCGAASELASPEELSELERRWDEAFEAEASGDIAAMKKAGADLAVVVAALEMKKGV